MKKIKVDPSVGMHTLITFLETNSPDSDVLFYFTKDNDIYKNASNLQILKNMADKNGKSLIFEVEDPAHKDFIEGINQETLLYSNEPFEFEHVSFFSKIKGLFSGIGKKSKKKSLPVEQDTNPSYDSNSSVSKAFVKAPKKKIKFLKPLLITLISLGVVVGGVLLFYINIPSAVVTLTLDSEGLVNLIDIKADPSLTEINTETGSIPVLEISVSETDVMAIPTTGEKEIGDKATGEVTIYNKTLDEKTFEKGTEIKLISKDKDSLVYMTTEEIKVSAKTEVSDPDDPTLPPTVTYGKRNVSVEASKYGEDYNISKDETFKIDGNDTDKFVGGNEEKISGGTSEIVHVVTQKDIDDLTTLLEDNLVNKAKASLQQKVVDGQSLNEGSVITSVVKKGFDNEIDDQVENLSLTMTMEASGLAYKKEDLDAVVSAMAKKSVPEKFNWDGNSDEYEVAVVKNADENEKGLNLQVKLTVHITPKINKGNIASTLSGMKLPDAEKYLNDLNNIKEYSIEFKNMPAFFVRLPLKASNIQIELVNK